MEEKKPASTKVNDNQATGVYIYSPSFLAEAIKALHKSLGFESKSQESITSCTTPNKKDDGKEASPPPPTKDPKEADPSTDDPDPPRENRRLTRSRTPPISSGGGGQINSTDGS